MAYLSSQPKPVTRYTSVAIILHWLIALAIVFQLGSGWLMVEAAHADNVDAWVFSLFQVHKTLGLTVLALTLVRIAWRLAHPAPALPDGMTGFERFAAHATHVAFYGLMLIVPLSGWLMVSVSPTGVPTLFLLLDTLPFAHLPIHPSDPKFVEGWVRFGHMVMAYAMGILALLHVAAALKHQFIAKDGLISRLVPTRRAVVASAVTPVAGYLGGLAAVVFLAGGLVAGQLDRDASVPGAEASSAGASSTGDWAIIAEESTLGFVVQFSGAPATGQFQRWSADIQYAPDALEQSSATIMVFTDSVVIDNSYLAPQIKSPDGFAVEAHPEAVFQSERFEAGETDGSFRAHGTITLRGVTKPIVLDFTYAEAEDGVAHVVGEGTVNRMDFGIGASGAADEGWIKHAVTITFDVKARPAGSVAPGS